ncbi:MAG: zinc ribbon domain-containing protein [Spirochaetes bacterium]|nr:zinc ribbon domain-containing protein [Spirochaetota bacterium]
MPTYEYECTKCGHTFEAFQSMKDAPLSSCPQCRGRVRRLIGGGMAVIFKGSGFYSTDNKKGSALTGGNGKDKVKDAGAEKTAEKAGEKAGEKTPAKAADSGSGSSKTEKTPVT